LPKKFVIGTRGSLLALTQTGLVKKELEEKTGNEFELKIIKTQGDQNTSVPLWQMEGKDFFTKELDEALLKEEVDLVVHSYKDLGSDRPEGIQLGAIGKRYYANDVLLIAKDTIKKLPSLDKIIIGTSSPRRIVNIESSLKTFLPAVKENTIVKCEMLRGNVNTRVQKLRDGNYHAIILAHAGLERLAHGEESLIELKRLIEGLDFMILPQSEFPSSASQGALGIECLSSRKDVQDVLSHIHDEATHEEVRKEREEFQKYGGGCHLAVGIHVTKVGEDFLYYQKGEVDNTKVNSRYINNPENIPFSKVTNAFLGLPKNKISSPKQNLVYDELIEKVPQKLELDNNHAYFVTSSYAISSVKNISGFIFASGNKTWKQMAKEGIWVNGSSDSLGHEVIENLKNSKFLQLFYNNCQWIVLTHKDSQSNVGETKGCYERKTLDISDEYKKQIADCPLYYWTSYNQFETFSKVIPEVTNKEKVHCCGLGKTKDEFIKNKIKVNLIADMNQFTAHFS
jgi:hydroxymethylbilane synthase